MKEKSETSKIFKNFHVMVRIQLQESTQALICVLNSTLGPYLLSNGIVHQSTFVGTPQQNGVAEHKNRHLLEVTRSLVFNYNIPK